MGRFKKGYMPRAFNAWDLNRGMEYFRWGRVRNYLETQEGDNFCIHAQVQGSRAYDVRIEWKTLPFESLSMQCGCPRFGSTRRCKHTAAVLYAHFAKEESPETYPAYRAERVLRTSAAGQLLLSQMRNALPVAAQPDDPIRAVPVLRMENGSRGLATLTLKLGRSRLYVERDLLAFASRVNLRETHTYGKHLEFAHDLAAFDERGRAVVDYVCRRVRQYEGIANQYGVIPTKLRGGLPVSAAELEERFDFLSGLDPEDERGGSIEMRDGEPVVTLRVKPQDGMVAMYVELSGGSWSVEKGVKRLFCMGERKILRCGEAFSDALGPMLTASAPLVFAPKDMPVFCGTVLPEIRDHVRIIDRDALLEAYLPETCTPRFYMDMEEGTLSCRLVYHYESADVPCGTTTQGIMRDARTEEAARQLLSGDFTWDAGNNRYVQNETNRALTLLTGPMEAYRAMGEVYLSDRLRARQLPRPKAALGVSLSGGSLRLSADLGDFPAEELEALYNSMLLRRKYHLLKDGRFMRLEGDGAGIEALAEAAHMTQLPGAALEKGEASLPAYRAPYLEGLLEGREGLRVKRDERFREMARRFKTVENSDYPVPEGIRAELRPYQETGYRWMRTLESCGFGGILADEMGLGKTLQTIAYFASRPRSGTGLPHLVVCPASLVLNWKDEMARFAPDARVKLIDGTRKERAERIAAEDEADVWVTSYDLLKRDIDLYEGHEFHTCVLDEGQFVKNQSTKASQAVKRVTCRQRFVLTGTPIENRLSELWNLFDFLMPGYLFSHQRFVERLEKPIASKGDAAAKGQLTRLVKPFLLRRMKADVLRELPEKIEHVLRVPLGEDARKLYTAQAMASLRQLSGSSKKLDILAALTRLRQICCDPALCFENYDGESAKLEACMELVQGLTENGHQVLLFSQFTSMLDRIRARLEAMKITSFTLEGSTPRQERADLVREFGRGGAQVFLISLKAGGTGLNLTAADAVIHFDPWWNVAAQNQATDRAHRIGQKNCVQVYKLIAENTVEERILELQRRKESLLDAVTADSGEGILDLKPEELLALMKEQ